MTNDSDRYLSLLKVTLTASVYPESAWLLLRPSEATGRRRSPIKDAILRAFAARGLAVVKVRRFDAAAREEGIDWPMIGYSMVGLKRLDNIEYCLKTVQNENIDGDFVECGVWRGGASIFAKAMLDTIGEHDRKVWLADSFEGMPVQRKEDEVDPALAGRSYIAVSLDTVQENFRRFGVLDDRVKFVKGWFADTLPTAPIQRIAVLRLDGDYYSSTMDALTHLYDKVSHRGFIIIDDYFSFQSCRQAIHDYCKEKSIDPEIVPIDKSAVYFRK
jgi:O-methyltransferase